MNFNTTNSPEYNLSKNLIKEVINLYGILVKLLVVSRINKDDIVFGDHSHLLSDSNKIYDLYMLPENSEDYDSSDFAFNQFGLTNYENISLFISTTDIEIAGIVDSIPGNLVVLPNNKVMEIVNASYEQPGINNLFVYNDAKSVIKITCKPYDFKLINEVDNVDISVDPEVPYTTLDTYFSELIDQTAEQDTAIEITPSVTTIQKTGTVDIRVTKPMVDKDETDIWNGF